MDSDKYRRDQIAIWALLREVAARSQALCEEAERLSNRAAEDAARDTARSERVRKQPASGGDDGRAGPPALYIKKRQELREGLQDKLEPALEAALGARQRYQAMLALVAYFDERERLALGELAQRWSLPLLQTELLEIDDGGERFFDELLAISTRADVYPLLAQLFLWCLRAGFQGRCRDKPEQREQYLTKLEQRVRQDFAPTQARLSESGRASEAEQRAIRAHRVAFVSFPYRYYGATLALLGATFVLLRCSAAAQVAEQARAHSCAEDRVRSNQGVKFK